MSSDLIGRRRASEQRLDRARSLELALKEKMDLLVETTGMSIEQLDFDGSFRAALTALAAVAARRTHFDIIVTLPDAPFAMRIQHADNAVTAEVLVQRDGPFEPVTAPTYAAPALPAAAYSASADAYTQSPGDHTETPAAYAESPPAYAGPPPAYAESAQVYAQPSGGYVDALQVYAPSSAHAVPSKGYLEIPAVYTEPSPTYTQSSSGYVETSTAHTKSPTAYAQSSAACVETPGAHAQSSGAYTGASGTYAETTGTRAETPVAVRSGSAAEPTGMVQVASDLADLLWQGVDDMPS